MGEGDYLGEARGHTLPRGQLLAVIVRVVEEKAAEDDGYRKLADTLRAQLVDPDFDLDAPVDLADLMAIIAGLVTRTSRRSTLNRRGEMSSREGRSNPRLNARAARNWRWTGIGR